MYWPGARPLSVKANWKPGTVATTCEGVAVVRRPLDVVVVIGQAGPGQADQRGAVTPAIERTGEAMGIRTLTAAVGAGVPGLVRRHHLIVVLLADVERAGVGEGGHVPVDGVDRGEVRPVGRAEDLDARRVRSRGGARVGPVEPEPAPGGVACSATSAPRGTPGAAVSAGNSPSTEKWSDVPTSTWPLVTTGTVNLTEPPNRSRWPVLVAVVQLGAGCRWGWNARRVAGPAVGFSAPWIARPRYRPAIPRRCRSAGLPGRRCRRPR